MRMIRRAIGLATAMAALVGQGASLQAQDIGLRVGAAAPVVKVNDLDGNPVDLGQWVGKKPVMIQFWATWCENCELLMPLVRAAQGTVGDRVEFLGINVTVNQTPERVRRYMQEHDVPFRVLYDDQGTSTRAYEAPATSYVVILDRAGKVLYTGVGADQRFEAPLTRAAGL